MNEDKDFDPIDVYEDGTFYFCTIEDSNPAAVESNL